MTAPFVPSGYTHITQAIAAFAKAHDVDIATARADLRRQLSAGELAAFILHDQTGALLKIAANSWNVDRCLPWMLTGKAERTVAEWQGRWNPLAGPVPLCLVVIETDVADADITRADGPAPVRTKSDIERLYKERVESALASGVSLSRSDDEAWARSVGISRDRIRELREHHLPPQNKKVGRKPKP